MYRYEVVPWTVWGTRGRDAVKLGMEHWDILAGLAEDKKTSRERDPSRLGDQERRPEISHQGDRKGLSPFWLHLMDKPLNLALERGHRSAILQGEGLTAAAGRRPGQKWSDLHGSAPSWLMKAWAQGPLSLRPSHSPLYS